MPGPRFELCRIDDIPPGGSRGFSLEAHGRVEDIFVVSAPFGLVAYHNSCPHTGVPLDWVPDQFLNLDGDLVQCSTHGALFRIDDGVCVRGPCVGRSLTPVRVEVTEGRVSVVLDAADEKDT